MGEVYRAHDTKLNRDVAIKVLPETFTADPDRLARFKREAQVLAALNQPNIAHIYGLEELMGQVRREGQAGQVESVALVMELVEGEDLAEKIGSALKSQGSGLPVDEALAIAKQIADALECAHEQGIVHRDLKPANIKVRPDGTVKVLDFGLAKAMDSVAPGGSGRAGGAGGAGQNLSLSPTLTSPVFSQIGVILGTAAYMAPEQARGKAVDKRADIWAFGCVLYEMLTGKPPFPGDDISHVLARVIEREPDFAALPSSVPARVTQAIRVCLRKDPKARAADIRDVRLALDGAFETAVPQTPASVPSAAPRARVASLVGAAAVVGVIALAVPAFHHLRETVPSSESYRFEIAPPAGFSFATFRLSPDGRYVAYVAARAAAGARGAGTLWIRPLDSLEPRQIAGSDGTTYPFWSPDSAFVGFFQSGKLKKVAVAGGPAQTICDVADARGGAWAADGTILFTDGASRPIFRVPSSGGTPTAVTRVSGNEAQGHRWPELLPDGRHFLISASATNRDHAGLAIGAFDGSEPVRLLADDSNGIFSRGRLFFLRDQTLMALPFDPVARKATGEAFPVVENVGIAANVRYGAFSIAQNGTLAYWSGGANTRELVWMDRAGKRESSLGEPRDFFGALALSPDEKMVAATIRAVGASGRLDVWLLDSASGLPNRFTFGRGGRDPVWFPDGKTLVYGRPMGFTFDVVRKALSGGAEDVLLAHTDNAYPSDVSPDGKSVAHNMSVGNMGSEIGLLTSEGDHRASVFLSSPANERQARFSPDGKWMAYQSDESGQFQIYVQTIPASGDKFQISTLGGSDPAWRRDGKELFYLDPAGRIMALPVKISGTAFEHGGAQPLFTASGATTFAAAHDGQRFLVNVPAGGEAAAAGPPLTVVTHWTPK